MNDFKYRKVTFEVVFMDSSTVEDADLLKCINHHLDDYSDGRFPLDVEMLVDSAGRVYMSGGYEALALEEQRKCGDDMVDIPTTDGTKHRRAKWSMKASERHNEFDTMAVRKSVVGVKTISVSELQKME